MLIAKTSRRRPSVPEVVHSAKVGEGVSVRRPKQEDGCA
jgi:hypothetical protein